MAQSFFILDVQQDQPKKDYSQNKKVNLLGLKNHNTQSKHTPLFSLQVQTLA